MWRMTEAAAAFVAVSKQYEIIAGTLSSFRHSSTALNTAVTQAEKAPKAHTSRFVQIVLEMMQLQAPLWSFVSGDMRGGFGPSSLLILHRAS